MATERRRWGCWSLSCCRRRHHPAWPLLNTDKGKLSGWYGGVMRRRGGCRGWLGELVECTACPAQGKGSVPDVADFGVLPIPENGDQTGARSYQSEAPQSGGTCPRSPSNALCHTYISHPLSSHSPPTYKHCLHSFSFTFESFTIQFWLGKDYFRICDDQQRNTATDIS